MDPTEKEQNKTKLKNEKLKKKMKEHNVKINDRLKSIKRITDEHDMPEMRKVNDKFGQAYKERKEFGKELMKAKQNCMALKSKVDEFLKEQNMLMIKLKGGFKKKANR